MAKLVFFNLPAYGHINPTLKLIKALVDEGEEVVYYTSSNFQSAIENTGAIFHPYPVEFHIDLVMISENIFRSAKMLMDYTHEVLPQLLPQVEQLQPDYIMHDSLCIWGKAAARHLDIPAIGSSAIMQPAYAGGAFKWPLANLMSRMLWKGISSLPAFFLQSWRLKRKYKMPFYFIPQTYINREKLNIVYTSAYFHPGAEKLGNDYLLIGPPGSPPVDNAPFPLEKLKGNKVIYISLGTVVSAGQVEFYKMCFDAFANLDAVVVLSTGAFNKLEELEPIPENFIVRTFAPQPLLMPLVNVFITHGGMNSIHDGMRHEVPLLVIPQTFEQTLNALAIQKIGAGIVMRPDKQNITTKNMRENVDKLLITGGYQQNLQLAKQSFDQAGGINQAVEAILEFIG